MYKKQSCHGQVTSPHLGLLFIQANWTRLITCRRERRDEMTCGSWWRVEWKGIRLKVPLDWRGASHLLEVGGAIDWLHQQIRSPTD